jgi:Tol biopolymer transport system component
VSVSTRGAQANDYSNEPALSADGRFVAFRSYASNLVPGDTNSKQDVFVHDRQRRTTTRVSVGPRGTQANDSNGGPVLSANGRFVAFYSYASNLVPGDTNSATDVFVHDRQRRTTTRVSVGPRGVQGNGDSEWAALSADGRFVAFHSEAINLVLDTDDTNDETDIFVHDRQRRTTTRVSLGPGGAQGDNDSYWPALSANGRFVAFLSYASNLVPGDTNGKQDVFVHDRQRRTTTRVSVGPRGVQGNDDSGLYGTIAPSADGRFVAFASDASNLVPGDTNGTKDVFVRIR